MADENEVVNTTGATTVEATEPQVETPEVEATPEPEKEQPKEQFIPKSRFDEVNDERNSLREQNRLLIEMQNRQNQQRPVAPEPEPDYLDPAVKSLADKNKRLEAALGGVANKLDQMEARSKFKDYDKYSAEVERVHNDFLQRGQFINRELIYTNIKGQEAMRGGNRQVEKVVEAEPEKPAAIPQTRTAAKSPIKSNKPETLEEEIARLSKVQF